jgi:hypothetical protein
VLLKELSIDVLGAQMAHGAARQNVENSHSGNGGLKTGAVQIVSFQSSLRNRLLGEQCSLDYPLGPNRSPVES